MMFEKLGAIPDFMQGRYDRATTYLEKLAAGEMLLTNGSTSLVTSGDSEAWSTTGSFHPVFSPVLEDIDQVEDIDYVNAEKTTRVGDGG
jgi:hypothetical protein